MGTRIGVQTPVFRLVQVTRTLPQIVEMAKTGKITIFSQSFLLLTFVLLVPHSRATASPEVSMTRDS